jgi:hypothetical protein
MAKLLGFRISIVTFTMEATLDQQMVGIQYSTANCEVQHHLPAKRAIAWHYEVVADTATARHHHLPGGRYRPGQSP